jgi:prophage regulatory protein
MQRILCLQEVMHRVGLRRTTIYKLIKQGLFPRQVSLSDGRVGWLEDQVSEWIDCKGQQATAPVDSSETNSSGGAL